MNWLTRNCNTFSFSATNDSSTVDRIGNDKYDNMDKDRL